MGWVIAIVVVVAVGVAAAAAVGGFGEMKADPVRDVYRQDLPQDRLLTTRDLDTLRFGVTLRGYAMDQVDDVLDRVGVELHQRDDLIRELTGQEPALALARHASRRHAVPATSAPSEADRPAPSIE